MFLTIPLTTTPSARVSSSFSRSSPMLASSTARRDSTTLLRLRSSLMTLNSVVFPSYGVVSLTGRKSTSEPGRNARMPLVMRSEEHTSELQSLMRISYAVFCLKKKTVQQSQQYDNTIQDQKNT